jgi:hypothetical protein
LVQISPTGGGLLLPHTIGRYRAMIVHLLGAGRDLLKDRRPRTGCRVPGTDEHRAWLPDHSDQESRCGTPQGLQPLDRATCIGEFDVLCD